MAEGRRSLTVEKLETEVKEVKETLQSFMTRMTEEMQKQREDWRVEMGGLSNQVCALVNGQNQGTSSQSPRGQSGTTSTGGPLPGILPRTTKLDFPKFDGEDPTSWLYKAEQFFQLNAIPHDQKVKIACYHLDHEAGQWYQWYEQNIGYPTWEEFKENILVRFGPSSFEDFTGALTKLKQTRSVREYQTEFEKLSNRTSGLNEAFFVSCFISGLKEEIQAEVKMFNPKIMQSAVGLARLADAKLTAQGKWKRPQMINPVSIRPPMRPESKPLPVKRLSPAEMQKRRAQGLCYNCDEKYSWGHKCVEQRLYVLDADLSEDPTVEEVGEPLEVLEEEEEAIMEAAPDQETPPQISLHALAGFTTPQTMKVQGHLKCHQPLVILIDSGSTHNFMDPRVAKQGGCYVYPCNSFEVLIANGGKMSCKGKCCNVKVTMGDYNLKSNMYLLPLGGCDMVLGAQWLCTLGPILWDFQELWMQFTTGGKKYTLNGL